MSSTAVRPAPTLRPAAPPWAEYVAIEPETLPDFRLYRSRPGHPRWLLLDSEAAALEKEIAPHLELPRRGPAAWRRKAMSYRTALVNSIENRRRDRAGREDLLPLYFIWTTHRACNFRCTYCDDHRGRKYPELPNRGALTTEQGIELLRIMRSRTPSVYFAGGEPTARKDLPAWTRAARDLDYYPIVVNTNGSLFHRLLKQPQWLTWLADIDVIVVSLDGLDLEQLAAMWVYRAPSDVLRNLLLLRRLSKRFGFKLMVNTVIQPGAVEHARDVLDFANDLGITFCPVPMNVGPRVDADLGASAEYHSLVEAILERKRRGYPIVGSLRMNERLLRSEPLDCRNTVKPHIDYDGALMWPCKAAVNREPVKLSVLDFDDVDDLYAEASRQIDPTGFHGPAPEQCGANCNWAQNYSTDAYLHGLRNPTSLLRDIAGFVGRS